MSNNPAEYKFIGMVLPKGIPANNKKEVVFTVCLNINRYCSDFITESTTNNTTSPLPAATIQKNYREFYTGLQSLKNYLNSLSDPGIQVMKDGGAYQNVIGLKGADDPFEFLDNQEKKRSKDYYDGLRKMLWGIIFPESGKDTAGMTTTKQISPGSVYKRLTIGMPQTLVDDKDLRLVKQYVLNDQLFNNKILSDDRPQGEAAKPLNKKLAAIHEFGRNSEVIARNEKLNFINRYSVYSNGGGETILKQLQDIMPTFAAGGDIADFDQKHVTEKAAALDVLLHINELTTEAYLDCPEIDMDEVINNFNAITNEPALMRLIGLARDYKFTLPDDFDPDNKFSFWIKCFNTTEDIRHQPAKVDCIQKGGKYAYLLSHRDGSLFTNSVLRKDDSGMMLYDLVSKIQKIADYADRLNKGETVNGTENKETLTRGFLFTNKKLPEIIQPVDIIQKNTDGTPVLDNSQQLQFIDDTKMTDEHYTRGHRVCVMIDQEPLYSLTSRSLELSVKPDGDLIYSNGVVESCIHFDAPLAYLQDGKTQTATSDVLFEYSGELLKLKSAFSKANSTDKAEQIQNAHEYHHDDGLQKSVARFKKAIGFNHFPVMEVPGDSLAYLNCLYGIPENFSGDHAPRLRFGKKYTFFVHQEYLNGWGLPLSPTGRNSLQLSLEEIIRQDQSTILPEFYVTPVPFRPLENKKAVSLHHRKEFHDDPGKPIAERASLDHLVVRSDDGDGPAEIDERHVLPPKVEIETAFFYGLLSKGKMSPDKALLTKRKATCPYSSADQYSQETSKKDNSGRTRKCPEGCSSFCGAEVMKAFYPEKHIYPKYLTDPSVKGFILELFWDKQHTIPVTGLEKNQITVGFGGTAGLEPKSYLLRAKESKDETYVENVHWLEVLEVGLKKGMQVYATLTNDLDEEELKAKSHLLNGWWMDLDITKTANDLLSKYSKELKAGQFNQEMQSHVDERNRPKNISLTHAVKEPLFTPKILNLASTPADHKKTGHIIEWLKGPYAHYQLDKNVIGERTGKKYGASQLGGTFSVITLRSHFERLDAIRKIEFLDGIVPSGALELWMRREEFADDPDQVVLDPQNNPRNNHLPEEPVLPFKDKKNVFSLDYKVEFTTAMLAELKDYDNVEDIDSIADVFRSLISKMKLSFDFKSTKFEEREYYLKDISKFKGYFSDEKLQTEAEEGQPSLEEYTLPKLTEVMDHLEKPSELRFKVMVLNNLPPVKPEVAYAVTTIQETRSYPEHNKTYSIQKGNIVTIYLKRGRLTSGKEERVGVIVESDSVYGNLFRDNGWVSKAGKDILSDRYPTRRGYLQPADIVIPKENEYSAGYENDLGLYHFLPKFDIEKQLWKFEVELAVTTIKNKQLHNPFINFCLVHYQPFSVNYNDRASLSQVTDLKNDCRLSPIENAVWCYLLPERKLSVHFNKPGSSDDKWGYVDLTIAFDHESLHHFNYKGPAPDEKSLYKIRSNFIVTVGGSQDGKTWEEVNSQLDNGDDAATWGFHHPLLTKEILSNKETMAGLKLRFKKFSNPSHKVTRKRADGSEETVESNPYYGHGESVRFRHFMVRFIEVEWFLDMDWEELLKKESKLLDRNFMNRKDMRKRYVELIY